ncbi:phosphatidate cytidylyltransferase [Acidobacteriota bacterium]
MSFKKRTSTALVLLALVFLVIQYSPKLVYFLAIQGIVIAALLEFYGLAKRREQTPRVLLGILFSLFIALSFLLEPVSLGLSLFACLVIASFYYVLSITKVEKLKKFPSSIALTVFGAVYLSFTLNYFYLLREERGPYVVYFMLAVIFIGDTGAYAVGKLFGKHKMAPIASPNKTWEGSFGGIITACLGGVLAQQVLLNDVQVWKAVLFAFLIHAVAQVSDPTESLFKRAAGVKDSSNLLPGHGGFLDRVDSLVLATPLFYYLVKFIGF